MLSKNQIKRIQSLARKKGRREEGCFIAEGNKLVEDTLSAFECDLILATSSWIVSHAHESLPKIQEVDEQEMSKVSQLVTPPDVLAVYRIPEYHLNIETLKKESYGYNLDVTVLGIDDDNPYFPIATADKKNEIVISSAAAQKFGVKVGDKLVLSDEVNERDYAFTVKNIVHFTSGVYVFLDRDVMQELFDQEDDYYNVVFADHALDIDNGRLYATVSKDNVAESSQIFTDMMGPMVVMLVAISALIFMIVMYLMMKVMIDRSAFSISLMKVFGYRRREIRRLYLDGNFYVILLGAVICVPLAKWSMDLVYPYCIANVAIGMDLKFTPQIYIMIYGGILLCYMVINFLLVGRLNKLVPAEVLKNRE